MNEQISVFDLTVFKPQQVKIDKPIRLIELFAGIGSQAKALVNLGADFEHYKVIEFDKYAMTSYNAIHKTNFETSDIRNIRGGAIRDSRYGQVLLHNDLFIPLPGFEFSRKAERNVKGKRNKERPFVGS